jgi:hypothetical protein
VGDITEWRSWARSSPRPLALLLLLGLCAPACGARSPVKDAGSGAPDARTCRCDVARDQPRCVGAAVEKCVAGRWQVTQGCSAAQVCALGQCRDLDPSGGCPDQVRYRDQNVLRERYPAVAVSSCVPGGDIGRVIAYHENKSETRARSLAFVGLVGCADVSARLPPQQISAAFGVDVDGSVSTDISLGVTPSAQIPPHQIAVIYRQTERIERVAELYRKGRFVGLAVLTDWTFTPEFAIGSICPVPSALPPAATFGRCIHQSDGCQPCLGAEP